MSNGLPPKLYIVFEGTRPVGVFLGVFTTREAAERLVDARRHKAPAYVVPYVLDPEFEELLDG